MAGRARPRTPLPVMLPGEAVANGEFHLAGDGQVSEFSSFERSTRFLQGLQQHVLCEPRWHSPMVIEDTSGTQKGGTSSTLPWRQRVMTTNGSGYPL